MKWDRRRYEQQRCDEARDRRMGSGVHPADQRRVGPSSSATSAPKSAASSHAGRGGALVVSNHSGGMFTPDVLVFAPAFYEKFGFDRPVYTLAHYGVLIGQRRRLAAGALGVIEASRENAGKALRSGAVVLVFPGGDYDSYRPTFTENVIDFGGRTGYVRTAIEAGVPIVPMVSIGGQETQLFLARGDSIARRLGLKRCARWRSCRSASVSRSGFR